MRKISNQELGRPTPDQFARMERMPVTIILDNIRSLQNVGSFFRTGDAFAVEHICLCGITGTPPDRDIHKTALGAELTVGWSYHPSTAECVRQLKSDGCCVLAVEQIEGATMLGAFQAQNNMRYALIFGNEVDGVEQQAADLCDGAIEIPQAGTKHSVNVSVAGGIVLWDFFCQIGPKH